LKFGGNSICAVQVCSPISPLPQAGEFSIFISDLPLDSPFCIESCDRPVSKTSHSHGLAPQHWSMGAESPARVANSDAEHAAATNEAAAADEKGDRTDSSAGAD
jgi:hypothetical protein